MTKEKSNKTGRKETIVPADKPKVNKSQHVSTSPTRVESVEWTETKKRNQENKEFKRRAYIVSGYGKTDSGQSFTHNAVQIGRNEPCHCGSGAKYKKCHLKSKECLKRLKTRIQHSQVFS